MEPHPTREHRTVCGDLAGADLTGADLRHANLSHANLSHAVLTGANLTRTRLTTVRFCRTIMPDGSYKGYDCERRTGPAC